MLGLAIVFFALAAVLGLYLLTFILQNKNTPKGITFTHGPLAAIGIVLLIIYAVLYSPKPWLSIIIFIAAASGGFLLVFKDITGKPIPKWLAVGHGFVAVVGFVSLLLFYFKII